MYSLHWDPSTNALFANSEGKFFPQKILSLQQNSLVTRKFNFYTENVLATRSLLTSEYVYSAGVNGQISRIAKKVSILEVKL